jgi:hypothetical protein
MIFVPFKLFRLIIERIGFSANKLNRATVENFSQWTTFSDSHKISWIEQQLALHFQIGTNFETGIFFQVSNFSQIRACLSLCMSVCACVCVCVCVTRRFVIFSKVESWEGTETGHHGCQTRFAVIIQRTEWTASFFQRHSESKHNLTPNENLEFVMKNLECLFVDSKQRMLVVVNGISKKNKELWIQGETRCRPPVRVVNQSLNRTSSDVELEIRIVAAASAIDSVLVILENCVDCSNDMRLVVRNVLQEEVVRWWIERTMTLQTKHLILCDRIRWSTVTVNG